MLVGYAFLQHGVVYFRTHVISVQVSATRKCKPKIKRNLPLPRAFDEDSRVQLDSGDGILAVDVLQRLQQIIQWRSRCRLQHLAEAGHLLDYTDFRRILGLQLRQIVGAHRMIGMLLRTASLGSGAPLLAEHGIWLAGRAPHPHVQVAAINAVFFTAFETPTVSVDDFRCCLKNVLDPFASVAKYEHSCPDILVRDAPEPNLKP